MKLLLDFLPVVLFFVTFKVAESDKAWASDFASRNFGMLVDGGVVGRDEAPVMLRHERAGPPPSAHTGAPWGRRYSIERAGPPPSAHTGAPWGRRYSSERAGAQNIAIVNGKGVPKARVDTLIQQAERAGQKVSPEMQQQARDQVVLREIFVQEAERKRPGQPAPTTAPRWNWRARAS
jgi:hypothetical protein